MNKLVQVCIFLFSAVFLTACSAELRPISYGDQNAPVQMDVYTDYKCTHCTDFFKNTFPEIKRNFVDTGKVLITFHEYPVLNQDSWDLAKASVCGYALQPEHILSLQNALFNLNTTHDHKRLISALENQQLPVDTMETCMNAPETETFIQEQKNLAAPLRIRQTPTFRIGTQQVEGNLPYSYFADAITLELKNTK